VGPVNGYFGKSGDEASQGAQYEEEKHGPLVANDDSPVFNQSAARTGVHLLKDFGVPIDYLRRAN
jgi:hypothetical protein